MAMEELLAGLWARRFRVLLLTLGLFGLGAAAVMAWPRSYVAEAVVAPAETTGIATSSLLSASTPIGGIFDPRPTGNFAIYLGSLRSAEAKVRADLEELARRRVRALEDRLNREPDLYIRQSLYELLAQSQRAGVVAAADEAVAARLVSAPNVGLRPSVPNRPLLLALLMVAAPLAAIGLIAAGLLLGMAGRRVPRLAMPEPAE